MKAEDLERTYNLLTDLVDAAEDLACDNKLALTVLCGSPPNYTLLTRLIALRGAVERFRDSQDTLTGDLH